MQIPEAFFTWAKATPWRKFMALAKIISSNGSAELLVLPQRRDYPLSDAAFEPREQPFRGANKHINVITRAARSKLQEWMDDLTMASYFNFDHYIPLEYTRPELFLPPNEDGSSDIDMKASFDLTHRSTQLEFLKLAVNLISNNLRSGEVAIHLVDLAEDTHNLSLLQNLLSTNLLSVEAFAEKLLAPAAAANDLPLVRTLLNSGIDPNAQIYFAGDTQTALQSAIEYASDDLVICLLDHGADTSPGPGMTKFLGSLLDYAVYCRGYNIVKEFLKPRPRFNRSSPKATIDTACVTLRAGKVDILELLFHQQPTLLLQAKSEPWILFEAAAVNGETAVFDVLLRYGLTIEATNDFGRGSPLAVASHYGHTALIRYLLNMGSNANSVVAEEIGPIGNYPIFARNEYTYPLSDFSLGLSALHLALRNSDKEVLQLLLCHTDANRCCIGIFPIQIASYVGNEELLGILLTANIEVDAVAGNVKQPHMPPAENVWGTRHFFSPRKILTPSLRVCHHDIAIPVSRTISFLSFEVKRILGRPAIRIALERGHEAIFDMLLAHGAHVPNRDSCVNYWDPLTSAIDGGNRNLIRRVLRDFQIPNQRAPRCLATCIRSYGCEFAEELLATVAFDPKEDIHQPEVICNAIYCNNKKFVKMLLSHAKDMLTDLPPNYGAVGIAFAAKLNNVDMIQLFLEAGVKPYEPVIKTVETGHLNHFSHKLQKDTHALNEAISSSAKESIDLIIRAYGVIGNVENDRLIKEDSLKSAYFAAICKGNLQIVRMLTERGVEPDVVDFNAGEFRSHLRISALQYAFLNEEFEIAEYLLTVGADFNSPARSVFYKSHGGGFPPTIHTALQFVAEAEQVNLVKILLGKGADVNASPSFHHGATALQFAAIRGNFKIVNMLLEAGANINALGSTYEGRTAIEGAAEWGRLDMVKYLLEAGANIRGKFNINYRRTVYRALKKGHPALVRMIQQWKTERYGEEDCDTVDNIVATMNHQELIWQSLEAKRRTKLYGEVGQYVDIEDEEFV